MTSDQAATLLTAVADLQTKVGQAMAYEAAIFLALLAILFGVIVGALGNAR